MLIRLLAFTLGILLATDSVASTYRFTVVTQYPVPSIGDPRGIGVLPSGEVYTVTWIDGLGDAAEVPSAWMNGVEILNGAKTVSEPCAGEECPKLSFEFAVYGECKSIDCRVSSRSPDFVKKRAIRSIYGELGITGITRAGCFPVVLKNGSSAVLSITPKFGAGLIVEPSSTEMLVAYHSVDENCAPAGTVAHYVNKQLTRFEGELGKDTAYLLPTIPQVAGEEMRHAYPKDSPSVGMFHDFSLQEDGTSIAVGFTYNAVGSREPLFALQNTGNNLFWDAQKNSGREYPLYIDGTYALGIREGSDPNCFTGCELQAWQLETSDDGIRIKSKVRLGVEGRPFGVVAPSFGNGFSPQPLYFASDVWVSQDRKESVVRLPDSRWLVLDQLIFQTLAGSEAFLMPIITPVGVTAIEDPNEGAIFIYLLSKSTPWGALPIFDRPSGVVTVFRYEP